MLTISQTEELKSLLSKNKTELDRLTFEFLPKSHHSPEISQLYELMRDYPSRGGKGLRGTFCLLWCELFGGRRDDALTTAAAIELFQNWILIHDDIEDASDMRRGSPALHRKIGEELAINVGDALHGKMWELLLKNQELVGASISIGIMTEFAKMLNETTEGQHLELVWNKENRWDIEEQDYFLMVTKKAAWYTCISPAKMGTILALVAPKVAEEQVAIKESKDAALFEAITSMGTDLGISFQIVDDVLNLTADESMYGKELLGDIYEGKRTLMLIHLMRHADTATKRKLVECLSKSRDEKTHEEVQFVYKKMLEYKSIEYAKQLALSHSKSALFAFDNIVAQKRVRGKEAASTTRQLLEYMTQREY